MGTIQDVQVHLVTVLAILHVTDPLHHQVVQDVLHLAPLVVAVAAQVAVPVLVEVDVVGAVVVVAPEGVVALQKATPAKAVKVIAIILVGVLVKHTAPRIVLVIAMPNVLVIAHNNVKEDVMAAVPECVIQDVQAVVRADVNIPVSQGCIIKSMNKQPRKESIPWQAGRAKNITFIVTKDCQLACKYCYLVGKNENERMDWSVAKQAIDYILSRENEFTEEAVIWDFIGGEPFLEIDLIEKICDYIKTELFRLNHHWFNSYRFSFSTNGINYHSDKIQDFIKKNISHLSIGITIDGTRRKHDLNRIWKSVIPEKGSYDDVVKNIPLWLSQFPSGATKVTISSSDIP